MTGMDLRQLPGPILLDAKRRILAAWTDGRSFVEAVDVAAVERRTEAIRQGGHPNAAALAEQFIRAVGEAMAAAFNDIIH